MMSASAGAGEQEAAASRSTAGRNHRTPAVATLRITPASMSEKTSAGGEGRRNRPPAWDILRTVPARQLPRTATAFNNRNRRHAQLLRCEAAPILSQQEAQEAQRGKRPSIRPRDHAP